MDLLLVWKLKNSTEDLNNYISSINAGKKRIRPLTSPPDRSSFNLTYPDKKYKTIVIDPPWNLPVVSASHSQASFKHTGSLPYPTMTDDELHKIPISEFADDQCQLFLWVTHGTLPLGLELIKSWGFKYHCLLTWDKTKGITMCGFNRRTEYVIFAYKGKLDMKQKGRSFPTFFRETSTIHSRKPRIFYDLILKATPTPRLDMFARKIHVGFDAWGDQVEKIKPLEVFS